MRARVMALCIIMPVAFLIAIIGFITINKQVTVTFETNPLQERNFFGEEIGKITASPTGRINLPTPIRPGYTFMGWSSDIEGNNMVTKVKTTNVHLFAKWQPFQPQARLYVDGRNIRTMNLPAIQSSGLSTAFVPVRNWAPNILGAYIELDGSNDFFGWFYHDENGERVEFRTTTNGSSWMVHRFNESGQIDSGTPLASANRFFPNHNVALNAMFNPIPHTRLDQATNVGTQVNIRYLLEDGTDADPHLLVTGSGARTGRYGTHISALPLAVGNFVGWRLGSNNDIFQNEMFYLDPSLYSIFADEIIFVSVPLASTSLTRGLAYEKRLISGHIALHQIGVFSGPVRWSSVIIQDFRPFTNAVDFNFTGNAGNHLRFTGDRRNIAGVTQEQQSTRRFGESNHGTDNVRNLMGVVNLPMATNYAVAGKVFVGWRASHDNQIYSAGLSFNVPRGINNISFTAVWDQPPK